MRPSPRRSERSRSSTRSPPPCPARFSSGLSGGGDSLQRSCSGGWKRCRPLNTTSASGCRTSAPCLRFYLSPFLPLSCFPQFSPFPLFLAMLSDRLCSDASSARRATASSATMIKLRTESQHSKVSSPRQEGADSRSSSQPSISPRSRRVSSGAVVCFVLAQTMLCDVYCFCFLFAFIYISLICRCS